MIGAQIGAYRVLRQIGEGGMGAVWLAEHMMLGRQVAIKVLHREASVRPELVTRFFNEAKAATAISDPGIVQIFDFGQHSDGNAYIVMELLDGEPLDKRLARMGRLALGPSLRILRQVAASLGAAHQRGIVHRDLKPENVFLVRDPEVAGGERTKVLDFGIAKIDSDRSVKTHTKAVMGTPTFMSPEQCKGAGQVDQRSDVYSLGCMLFTLLTGRPPFEGDGPGDVIAMHLREPPVPPSTVLPGIPPAIDALVLRCLAKDRTQRFASGTELALALERLLADPVLQPFLVEYGPGFGRAPSVSEELRAAPSRELPATAPPSVLVAASSIPRVTPVSPTLVPSAGAALSSMPRPAVSPSGLPTPLPAPGMVPAVAADAPPYDRAQVAPRQVTDEQTTAAFAPVSRPLTDREGLSSPPAPPGGEGAMPRPYGAPLTTLSTSVAVAQAKRPGARWWVVGAALVAAVGGAAAIGLRSMPSAEDSSGDRSGTVALAVDGTPAVDGLAASADGSVAPLVVDAGVAPLVVDASVAPLVADAGSAAIDSALAAAPAADAGTAADPLPQVYAAMRVLLHGFEMWSREREEVAGGCPEVAEIGVLLDAALATHLRLTCVDQPKDQRIGVVWDGPDGVFQTSDDVRSWRVSSSQVAPVLGARWGAPKPPPRTPRRPHRPAGTQIIDKDGDGIPDVR